MGPIGENCEKCYFFTTEETLDDNIGSCTRFPPVPVFIGDQIHSTTPDVRREGWCGEFRVMILSPGGATPLDTLGLSVRATNSLRNDGIDTVEQLVAKQPYELIAFKNMGQTSLREIREKLASRNLSLKFDTWKTQV